MLRSWVPPSPNMLQENPSSLRGLYDLLHIQAIAKHCTGPLHLAEPSLHRDPECRREDPIHGPFASPQLVIPNVRAKPAVLAVLSPVCTLAPFAAVACETAAAAGAHTVRPHILHGLCRIEKELCWKPALSIHVYRQCQRACCALLDFYLRCFLAVPATPSDRWYLPCYPNILCLIKLLKNFTLVIEL